MKMAGTTEKLTKKQRKALEFRNKTKTKESTENEEEPKENEKKRKTDDEEQKVEQPGDDEPTKKKRKTRRGKKGKGNGSSGPRFLLFVGNLPYDVTETELQGHFSASTPDRIRIRTDKGIAFLEFDGAGGDIQHKMEVALRMHRSTLRNRKINVELTVGGGGNSTNRLEKIKEKNNKLEDERKDIIRKKKTEQEEKQKKKQLNSKDLKNVHPARAKLMQ